MFVTVAPPLWVALVVPLTPLAPPLKVFVEVLLAVKLMSSVQILISPVDGNADELVNTISVVVKSVIAVARVVVAGPKEVPPHNAVPQP